MWLRALRLYVFLIAGISLILTRANAALGDVIMMGTTEMPIGMMFGMGLILLLVVALFVLGIAALIKYLRS
jgi:hypothetical protein